MVKQYTVRYAYAGNTAFDKYEDGRRVGTRVVSDWEVDCYRNILEQNGYTRAYDMDALKRELDEAKEKYETLLKEYEECKPFALFKEE